MAVDRRVHVNECGLPLNSIEWLETHHRCKAPERERMIRELSFKPGCFLVDAGCGPGLWTPLLARAIGGAGRILGVDMSPDALVTAQGRSSGRWYEGQVVYKQGLMEELPLPVGGADVIFSANVSQYLADAVGTFAAMGRYLVPGGRIVVKDIDFGTMRFAGIDAGLQARVFQARERWEQVRVEHGFAFEDSWVGSKLAGYLRAAGYEDVQERSYKIVRRSPLSHDFRAYLQGIAEWFVCEGAPLLDAEDCWSWLDCFLDEGRCALDDEEFMSEETEFVVTGVWTTSSPSPIRHWDMQGTAVQPA